MRGKTFFAAAAVAAALAGCGGSGSSSSAPDVTGGSASDSATLFKAANLSRVLSQAKTHLSPSTQITTIKIEPRDVKIIGSNSTVTVDATGKSLTVVTPAIPSIGGTFTLSNIDPNVVQRIAAKAAKSSHMPLQEVAYVASVPDPINHTTGWGVYMTNQRHFLAELSGAKFHGVGGSTTSPNGTSGTPAGTPSPPAGTPSPPASGGSGGGGTTIDPQKIAACVQNAGGDPAKIAACSGH